MTNRLQQYVLERRARVNRALDEILPPADARPATLHSAMRYSVFAGGKRIRPILMLAAAEAREWGNGCDQLGAAIECIHTYSLIHDDLPALDDDDFRRGKPTCHKQYSESVAILAGDALLTLGLLTLATHGEKTGRRDLHAKFRADTMAVVARAVGTVDGMIGGQMADLEAEGCVPTPDLVQYIHQSKTAALIRASVVVGSLCGECVEEEPALHNALCLYGDRIGLAFQIVDDILDVVSSTEQLGKTAGKDARQAKATYPAMYGIEGSRLKAQRCLEESLDAIGVFSDRAWALRGLARWIVSRAS